MSKIKEAMRRVELGERISVVARELEISTAAIYAYRKRDRETPKCPCCGGKLKPGQVINRSVLK